MKIRVLTESGCGLTKQEANDLGIDFFTFTGSNRR